MIYVEKGINFIPRDDLVIYKKKELESFFIEIIDEKEKNKLVGVIYRHPCIGAKEFNEIYLTELMDNLAKENKTNYIAGDFNFDLIKISDHQQTSEFFDIMMTQFHMPLITVPTRINPKNNTLIDNIFTNDIDPDMISGNLAIGISDHLPSFLVKSKNSQKHMPKKHNIYTRDTKNFDRENFILGNISIDWNETLDLNKNDPSISLTNWFSKMNSLLDRYMPLKKVTKKDYKRQFKPWITDDILNKIKEKNYIFKKYIKIKDPQRKNEHFVQYKLLKNEILLITRQSKKDFYSKFFQDHKNNIKKTWEGIKEIVNIKSKTHRIPTCIIENNKTRSKPADIANSLNDYYISIADKIINQRKYNGNKSFQDYLVNPSERSIYLYECDKLEVKNLINSLKIRKGTGPNSIPTKILHLLSDDISEQLCKIFNLSLNTGKHPDILKIAKTIPIFKKGSQLLVSNYRPISLLSNINKILEKIMFKRVNDFLEVQKSIYDLQFGFRSKHSTNHALIDITENVRQALDKKMVACGIFVDLQKAFDTVNHDILIKKLDYYGIRGVANEWFSSYLNKRSQFVSISGYDSKQKYIKHGVPQRSVLGPLLFLIYINDLHTAINYSKVYHFADDTNLLNISKNPKELQKQVNIDLKLLHSWLIANKISLNCSKTELIFFHKPGQIDKSFNYKIKMNGHRIIPSDYIKYLGIFLDPTLSGKYQCEKLSLKLRRAIGMISKLRHYVSKDDLKSIYYAIFSSHLVYASQIWGHRGSSHFNSLSKLQERAMRVLHFEDFYANADPIFKSNKILKINDFVDLQNCLFVHDFFNNKLPKCFDNYFKKTKDIHSHLTGNSDLGCLYQPKIATTRYGVNSITKCCIKKWNYYTKLFKTDLTQMSRPILKKRIQSAIIDNY